MASGNEPVRLNEMSETAMPTMDAALRASEIDYMRGAVSSTYNDLPPSYESLAPPSYESLDLPPPYDSLSYVDNMLEITRL